MATQSAGSLFTIQRSGDRFFADHGWLKTYHSFSFAEYYDPQNVNWGALRVFNDDYVAGGSGFPPHPHRDMEIVTYVLEGQLRHEDSLGNRGIVGPGGVQFMSAGTGVRHSEFNNQGNETLHFLQMWVLPGTTGAPPSYGQRDFTRADRTGRWLVVASGEPGSGAAIELTQKATLRVARLEDAALSHTFAPQRYGFVFCAGGEITLQGETLLQGDAARLYNAGSLDLSGNGEVVFWDCPEA
jgi:quercetin 2,3-dioxygenase